MKQNDKFEHIAALRPARKREDASTPRLEIPAESDRIANLLGGRVRRNHYGEHLSVQQWYATPEMCAPDARSLSLLLPAQSPDAVQANFGQDSSHLACRRVRRG